ncbi:AMP-binding protein [Croceicoccus sp. YJ47]|uniref:AMP-binding protein n=1 Tax=Croceicoccus sp. YJ47 TaxID=2798724 RepID=UPI0021124E14|nr:AMP-binding protein [Croceicoccus sp. YJ47]
MADDAPVVTMGAMLRASARQYADDDALIFPDERRSYAELETAARRWARGLVGHGVRPGDHIGLLLPTRIDFIEAFYGIAMAGAVAVPINARYQAHELRYLVADADLTMLITTGKVAENVDFAERLCSAFPDLKDATPDRGLQLTDAPKLRTIVCLDQPCPSYLMSPETLWAKGETVSDTTIDARIDAVDGDDLGMILYTSGTTANPKGAMIGHGAQVGNSRNLGRRYEVTRADKMWSPLPIYHIAGILPMTMILDAGGAYMTVPHFDPGVALEMLGREGGRSPIPAS